MIMMMMMAAMVATVIENDCRTRYLDPLVDGTLQQPMALPIQVWLASLHPSLGEPLALPPVLPRLPLC